MSATEQKKDAISRASWLLSQGYVQPGDGADVLQCWSQVYGSKKVYTVTYDSCECYIGLYRKRTICKHRFACFGSPVVCLIMEIRTAISQCDLESIAAMYKEALESVDELFVAKARLEYRKRLEELRELAAA